MRGSGVWAPIVARRAMKEELLAGLHRALESDEDFTEDDIVQVYEHKECGTLMKHRYHVLIEKRAAAKPPHHLLEKSNKSRCADNNSSSSR